MKTKAFFQRLTTACLMAAMCLTFSCALVACDQSATALTKQSDPTPTPTPDPDPDPDNKTDYVYVPGGEGAEVTNNDTTVINGSRYASPGFGKLHLDEKLIKLFGEDLANLDGDVAAANAKEVNRSYRLDGSDTIFVTTLSATIAGGKNLATVTSETRRVVKSANGQKVNSAYLVTDNIRFTRIEIMTKASTRSEEWVLNSEFDVRVEADIIRHEAGITSRPARTNLVQHVSDIFHVQKYVKNDIVDWQIVDSVRVATSDVDEYEKYNIEYTKKDGEKFTSPIMLSMNYYVKPTMLADDVVSNFSFNLSKGGSVVWENGESLVKNTSNSKIYERHGSYTSDFNNSLEGFKTLYETMSQRTVYNDGLVKLSTGYAEMKISEKSSSVENVSSDWEGYSKGIFHNNIEGSYLGWTQSVQEQKNLYMKNSAPAPEPEDDKVISSDWANPDELILNDSYSLEIDWVEKHSKKGDVVTHYSIKLPRNAKCITNWKASVNKFYQATESYKKTLKGSSSKTKSSQDGLAQWSWDSETYSITALTALNGADSQLNEIESSESNNVSITREGKTHTWQGKSVLAPHDNGHLSKVNDAEYAYTLIMKYTFGSNTQEISCPGTLLKK
jgi:hypothetical protein